MPIVQLVYITANWLDDGSVDICDTHYSHTLSLGLLYLSNVIRKETATKLSERVTIDRLLDDVHDNVSTDFIRSHISTKRDIHNNYRKSIFIKRFGTTYW